MHFCVVGFRDNQKGSVGKTTITQRVVFAEAVAQGKSIFEIDPNGPAALEMLAVLDEIMQEHAP